MLLCFAKSIVQGWNQSSWSLCFRYQYLRSTLSERYKVSDEYWIFLFIFLSLLLPFALKGFHWSVQPLHVLGASQPCSSPHTAGTVVKAAQPCILVLWIQIAPWKCWKAGQLDDIYFRPADEEHPEDSHGWKGGRGCEWAQTRVGAGEMSSGNNIKGKVHWSTAPTWNRDLFFSIQNEYMMLTELQYWQVGLVMEQCGNLLCIWGMLISYLALDK